MKERSRAIDIDSRILVQEITRMFNEMGKKSITFVVRGYSMRPFLEDRRDKVTLVPPRQPKIGDVVLASIGNGRYALHRVIRIDDGAYTMQGDGNPTHMTERFTDADIIGIAESFIRKGKRVTTKSITWRAYSFTWRLLKPFRRILLGVYRRIK